MASLTQVFPPTTERVERNTAREVNERNRREIEAHVARYEGASHEVIAQRLQELEREWDMERTLEANAAAVILASLGLGAAVNRKWFLFTSLAAGFLLQHALQGWCPPVAPWRRAGVRTAREIEAERTALRILRGDFHPVPSAGEAVAQATSA
jgi:hypothetical protein